MGLLDTPPEERFERFTRIARQHYQVKTALFTVLDHDRQWFKSKQGLDVTETPRSVAFCDHAIRQDQIFVVEDATQDPRFRNNPLVLDSPHIRFYAGMPVYEPSGFKIGSLCIIDDKPRQFSEKDLDVLRTLATMLEEELKRSYIESDNSEYVPVSHLNRAIHRAQSVFLNSDNERSAFEQMLNDLLVLTGSQFGFIGEVLHEPNGTPFLKIGAITNIAWSPATQALYQEGERRRTIFDGLDNILGQPMVIGETIISNNLATDSRRGGLPNRHRLTELFEQELYEAGRRNGTVSVCYIDLDGFKTINDNHGHAVGDAVLRSVAAKLQTTVRSHDIVARLGGDEFVAILRDVDDERAYARLLDAIRQPISFRHNVLQVSGSMGVTVYPDDDTDTDLLLRHADQAMYAAKETGKNCFKVFDLASHSSRKERVRVLEQIKGALRQKQMELYYQPKICFRNQSVDGFEALIRWNHPKEGVLSPGHFLEHIEYTEYARTLGNFVIREGVKRLMEFAQQDLQYTLSINLSPSHFLSQQFRNDLSDALSDCPRELRSHLILEILETTAMDDTETVLKNLEACRELGVDVPLDDFGTGYSSLDYLRRLPAQEIKIDRSFVMDMLNDTDDAMIVSLSKSFKRRLVAEGIESADVESKLIALGCDLGQGFFYSKPLPLSEALLWAANFRWEGRLTV
ncbi:GGDEF domain-containing protein [Marinobacter sp. LV10R510-11A]|uniref:sensor domain-containing phosphodiesterase n=1 Tax=Marinobacter sp. LV10R510-11A TaxID=1415568 RepID=UPI001D0CE67B|nr:GGDEF domain-containing protein [Marinobacter sp. LV10R510-11A]